MNKTKLSVKKLINISLIGILLITGVYASVKVTRAWFASGDELGALEFQALQIDSMITLYKANDVGDNGVPDLLSASGMPNNSYRFYNDSDELEYVEYELPYYTEVYDFLYLDTTLVLDRDEDSTANTFIPINVEDAFPGMIYTYKYALANYSFGDNSVYVDFDTSSETGLDNFKARIGKVNSDGTIDFGEWTEVESGGALRLSDDITVSKYTGKGTGRLDIWFQLMYDPEAENASGNKTYDFPSLRITFDADYDE